MSNIDYERLDRVIDFKVKKTESEWAYLVQHFSEAFTPLWFQWLKWGNHSGWNICSGEQD